MRIGASVALKLLFDVVETHDNDKISQAYLLAGIVGALWVFAEITKHNFAIEVFILFSKLKSQLVFLSFQKLMNLSSYNAKYQ